jgi:hypothetical protein
MSAETYINVIPCKRGHFERYVISKNCVKCSVFRYEENFENISLKSKKRYQENKDKEDFRFKVKTYRKANPKKSMLRGAKNRAKLKGMEFNLVESDIVIPKYCPVYPEIELIMNDGKPSYNSPSLDRVDNNKGYIKGNVRVISSKANILKKNGSLEDFKRLIEYIESSSQEKN